MYKRYGIYIGWSSSPVELNHPCWVECINIREVSLAYKTIHKKWKLNKGLHYAFNLVLCKSKLQPLERGNVYLLFVFFNLFFPVISLVLRSSFFWPNFKVVWEVTFIHIGRQKQTHVCIKYAFWFHFSKKQTTNVPFNKALILTIKKTMHGKKQRRRNATLSSRLADYFKLDIALSRPVFLWV